MNKDPQMIDRYLNGQMSVQEKKEFELQLKTDAALRSEFEVQQQLVKGIERAGIKAELNKGFKKGAFKSKAGKWLMGIVVAALATSLVWVVKSKITSDKENIRYELNEENKKQWSEADAQLSPQVFTIKGESDTVIETKSGIIITIPRHAFLNNKADEVEGDIEIEVKEALNPMEIMKAGLSTTSDGKLLETGGMFYINARQNGTNLSIVQNKGVYVSIPDRTHGKNMMLFDGQRDSSGGINWVNPKPFENKLNTVDILSLNFYPPHFLDSLQNFGIDIKNKTLTDSIYYSFMCGHEFQQPAPAAKDSSADMEPAVAAQLQRMTDSAMKDMAAHDPAILFRRNCAVCHSLGTQKITGPGLAGIRERVPGGDWLKRYILNNEKVLKSGDAYANKIYNENGKAAMTIFEGALSDNDVNAIINYIEGYSANTFENSGSSSCEIAPEWIHTIWDRKFNNTILATHEFEERLQVIFGTCNHSLLDLYIKNMNKKMVEIDAMAMKMTAESTAYHQFEEFYRRHDGGVSISEAHMKKLQHYMEEKRKVYHDAVAKTLKELYEKEHIQDVKAQQEFVQQQAKDFKRSNSVFREELEANMKEAYRQLGKPRNPPVPPAANYFSATLLSPGWKNVDAYVLESTAKRTTLDYTDPQSGKKAVINYEPLTIKVTGFDTYDRVLAYLLPDKLSSFQRMPGTGDAFKENLNELFSYGAVVFGFKGDDVYCYPVAAAKPGEVTVSLTKMSKADLARYQSNAGAAIDLVSELNDQIFNQQESQRKNAIVKREEMRDRLWLVVFPCGVTHARATIAYEQ